MTLADTPVWNDGFRGGESKDALKNLIDNGSICINDIILAELLPSIRKRGVNKVGLPDLMIAKNALQNGCQGC